MSLWSEIKQALKVAVCAAITLGIPTVILLSCIEDCTKKQEIKPPQIEAPATTAREEIVTGMCNFGDCPVATAAIPTLPPTTDPSIVAKNETVEPVIEIYTLSDEPVAKNATTEPVTESHNDGYIGTFYITGYTAEEGFPEGSATASGYGVRPGYCALNSDRRRALGISWGDQIYVEGLGTFTVMDSGCDWNTVDIWCYTDAYASDITGYYEVYYV